MSLSKEPPTARCQESSGLAERRLAVVFATSLDFAMIEFQVSISISIATTPERMPRGLGGVRIEDSDPAIIRKWPATACAVCPSAFGWRTHFPELIRTHTCV